MGHQSFMPQFTVSLKKTDPFMCVCPLCPQRFDGNSSSDGQLPTSINAIAKVISDTVNLENTGVK